MNSEERLNLAKSMEKPIRCGGLDYKNRPTQKQIDKVFMRKLGNQGLPDESHVHKHVVIIRQWIQEDLGISLSFAETFEFWRWRSEAQDAAFLTAANDESYYRKDIALWLERFVERYG